jgi:hypothetical protein
MISALLALHVVSATGKCFAFGSAASWVVVREDGSLVQRFIHLGGREISDLAVSPDCEKLVFTSAVPNKFKQTLLYRWDSQNNQEILLGSLRCAPVDERLS